MSRAAARAPGRKRLAFPGQGRKIVFLKRSPWEARGLTVISPSPGGPCSHHAGGQPSAVYVRQGDRGLRDAQGQGPGFGAVPGGAPYPSGGVVASRLGWSWGQKRSVTVWRGGAPWGNLSGRCREAETFFQE